MHPALSALFLSLVGCRSAEIETCVDIYESVADLCETDPSRSDVTCETEADAAETLGCVGQFNSRQRCRAEVLDMSADCATVKAQLNAACTPEDENFAECMGREVVLDALKPR